LYHSAEGDQSFEHTTAYVLYEKGIALKQLGRAGSMQRRLAVGRKK
jgi:hypothetical protein